MKVIDFSFFHFVFLFIDKNISDTQCGFKYLSHSSFKGLLLTFVHYLKFYFKYVSRLEKKIKFSKTKSVASTTIK